MSARTKLNQGMNWIRKEKRLAIYLRDGLACAYCGAGVEDSERLTLDHLKPYSNGGKNDQTNLVTCCLRCNSVRGNRPWQRFCTDVATYLDHSIHPQEIVNHIVKTSRRPINVPMAKTIIKRRGGFAAALRGGK